jgi:hypothetical protein
MRSSKYAYKNGPAAATTTTAMGIEPQTLIVHARDRAWAVLSIKNEMSRKLYHAWIRTLAFLLADEAANHYTTKKFLLAEPNLGVMSNHFIIKKKYICHGKSLLVTKK